ncbi:hypothetical protein FR762_17675 [Enterobacter sp. E76]|nr:hypothetical protein FR762_17675 [Enterobacter sp. E76]
MPLSEYINNRDGVAGLKFIRRMYFMRMLGTFLCFIPIFSVLSEQHHSHGWLILLSANAFIWGRLRKRNLWSLPFLQHRF